MYGLSHRYMPDSPDSQASTAIVASLIGFPSMVVGIIGLDPTNGSVTTGWGFLFSLIGVVTLVIAGYLALNVVRQSNAASAADHRDEAGLDGTTAPPIETLRRRYAEGELNDDEFQRRLDRLLETAELAEAPTDRERVLE